MKKFFSLMTALMLVFLVGCTKENHQSIELNDGNYVLVVEEANERVSVPCITINKEGTFSFAYGKGASFLLTGTYEIKGNSLGCSTAEDEAVYVFEIKDADTLVFNAKNSSELKGMDEEIMGKIKAGGEFKYVQKLPDTENVIIPE